MAAMLGTSLLVAFLSITMIAMVTGDHAPDRSEHATVVVGQKCLSGTHHPNVSFDAAQAVNYTGVCSHYRPNSCCTTRTASSIEALGDRELYNFHWDDCGTLSPECDRFLKLESCFYECDPYIWHWRNQTSPFAVVRVPICASFCNNWYEACRNDLICTDDFVNGFVQMGADGRYHCPANHTCRTFEQWYGNGRALCNRQWGTSFQYSEDTRNCLTMQFSGLNPNACSSPPTANGSLANPNNCQAFRDDNSSADRQATAATYIIALLTSTFVMSYASHPLI